MPAGRPSKYKPEYAEQVEGLCKLGATVDEIAAFFSVATSTVSKWIDEKPEFSEAVKAGRILADQRVAEALYRQAIEGNTTAAIFWLKNRRKNEWREKHEFTVERIQQPTDLTDDELIAIARAGGDGTSAKTRGPSKPDRVH